MLSGLWCPGKSLTTGSVGRTGYAPSVHHCVINNPPRLTVTAMLNSLRNSRKCSNLMSAGVLSNVPVMEIYAYKGEIREKVVESYGSKGESNCKALN